MLHWSAQDTLTMYYFTRLFIENHRACCCEILASFSGMPGSEYFDWEFSGAKKLLTMLICVLFKLSHIDENVSIPTGAIMANVQLTSYFVI